MKIRVLTTLSCAATLLLAGREAHATSNLLLNGGFEYAGTNTYVNGNNTSTTTPVVIPDWTLVSGNTNLQQGAAMGTGFAAANLSPYSTAYSGGTSERNASTDTGGNRFFDGTNDVNGYTVITQPFTLTTTTNLSGSYALGIRDVGGQDAGTAANFASGTTSRVQILNAAGTPIVTSYGDTMTTGQTAATTAGGTYATGWELNTFAVNNVAAGNYTIQVTLQGDQNIDAINIVPEPSSYVCVAGGLGGLLIVQRARRRRSS